ncbi:MAG: sialate O-acetylesterase [Verrucomicrobiota bacterium]
MNSAVTSLFTFLLFTGQALIGLELPTFFGDHMVLQRDKPIAIWGSTNPETDVIVTFGGEEWKTVSDSQGKWRVAIDPQTASAQERDLKIESGEVSHIFEGVLVGEVWFASGQSNMGWNLKDTEDAEAEIAAVGVRPIRLFQTTVTPAATPKQDVYGNWRRCSPDSVGRWPAVAYYFARYLEEDLQVPVGIIHASSGGVPVESFISKDGFLALPEGRDIASNLEKSLVMARLKEIRQAYDKDMREWIQQSANQDGGNESGERSARPEIPKDLTSSTGLPMAFFNGMIHPFTGYSLRGFIWYQGEANAKPWRAQHYAKSFSLMINDWRTHWNELLPFVWVQLASYEDPHQQPGKTGPWTILQNEQRRVLSLPNTGMVVANDLGDGENIHPPKKREVGRRLSLWALQNIYGEPVVGSGPLFREVSIEGNLVRVHFDSASSLKTRNEEELKGFEIAGEDRIWHDADSVIDGDTVLASSPNVPSPVAVRYAWESNPLDANLVNGAGLPASIFQSSDWPYDVN